MSRVLPPPACLAHNDNLVQKAARAKNGKQVALVKQGRDAYEEYLRVAYSALEHDPENWIAPAVAALSSYLEVAKCLEKEDPLFNWRSDYAGSVIPEFLVRFLHVVLVGRGLSPRYSGRDSVVELTLTGIGDGWSIRRKNQDICVGLENLTVRDSDADISFLVPIAAIEVKTNLDINKLSGLNFSAESLKRSFPLARYFIVTETVDFSLNDNYVAGAVDEIYVLRRAMRSKHRRTPVALCPEVFSEFFEDIADTIELASRARGHVYERLGSGKLIADD